MFTQENKEDVHFEEMKWNLLRLWSINQKITAIVNLACFNMHWSHVRHEMEDENKRLSHKVNQKFTRVRKAAFMFTSADVREILAGWCGLYHLPDWNLKGTLVNIAMAGTGRMQFQLFISCQIVKRSDIGAFFQIYKI